MWTIISGIFGGLLRLVPELFKYLDSKNERAHELNMQEKAFQFQQLTGSQKISEIQAQGNVAWDTGAIGALKAAIEGQDKPSGIAWIDGLSKLIRPAITIQWVIIIYPAVIICGLIALVQGGMSIIEAIPKVFGPEEKALVAFIVDFWFVGRVLERGRK